MTTHSAFTRFISRSLLAIVSFQLAFGTQLAAAQGAAPAPVPAGGSTTVTQSANGTPVLNIAAPNPAGVSHNTFNSYDVAKGGLILNNSSVNATSLIGGGTAANPNLANGSSANLILNEVIKPNAGSMLAGYQEIVGPAAQLVIANPWGITCNGCGFVNTPRVTLTTGTPTLNANGMLAGFTITGGALAIGANGLDATRQSTLDLLARSVSIGGNVIVGSQKNGVSGDLQVLGGAGHFDYASRTGTAAAGTGAPAQFAIDSSLLGGMYADRIRLLVNEAGAGVRLAGNVAALADDLVITAEGRIELRGAASSAGDLLVHGGDVQVALPDSNTYLYAGRDLSIDASGDLSLGAGSLGSQRNMSLNAAGALTDTGGTNDLRFNNAVLTAEAGGALDLSGGYWTAPQLFFNAASVHFGAGGTVYGTGPVSVTTPGLLSITGGKVYSNSDATLNAQRLEVDSAGVVVAAGALSASAAQGVQNGGVLQGGSATLTASDVANTGTIQAASQLNVNSTTLENSGKNALIVGSTAADGSAILTATTITNSGQIYSAGDLSLAPTNLTQQRTADATANPALGAGRDLTIAYTGDGVLGTGDLSAGRDLTITGASVTDKGLVGSSGDYRYAGRNLVATAAAGGSVILGGGQWFSNGDLRLSGDNVILGRYFDQLGAPVSVPGVQVAGAQSGTGTVALVARNGEVNLNTGAAVYSGCTSNCQNTSGGDLVITQNNPFSLAAGNTLQANGALSISAAGTIDNGGMISGGTVALASNNNSPLYFVNRGTGIVAGAQSIQIGTSAAPAGTVTIDSVPSGSQAGLYGGALALYVSNFFNNGLVQTVGGSSVIRAGQFVNSGSIQGYADHSGQGVLAITADSLTNYGTLFDAASLTVTSRNFNNTPSGSIGSPGVLSIIAGGPGANTALNSGLIGGTTVELVFHNGLVNGVDPVLAASGTPVADIFASDSLTLQLDNGSSLTNFARLESDRDVLLQFIGGGALINQMSMVPDSFFSWAQDPNTATTIRGGAALLNTGQNGSSDKHTFQSGNTGTTADFYYYFGDTFQTAAYQDTHNFVEENQQLKPGMSQILSNIPRPTISAGNNLTIQNFGSLTNNGLIEAANNVTLDGATPASLVTNSSLMYGKRRQEISFVESFTCQAGLASAPFNYGCGQPIAPNIMTDNGPYGGAVPVIAYTSLPPTSVLLPARIVAGGVVTINATLQNNGETAGTLDPRNPARLQNAAQANTVSVTPPGARGAGPALSLNGATIPLPTSTTGRFISAQGSARGPLIETNPLFGIDSIGLGSDYLAKLLGLNPDAEARRLGDDSYEAYLIEQQLVTQTGRSVLEGYGNVANMEDVLFNNAHDQSKALNLGYGKALTSTQIASLTSDIIWMVEQEVQGQKVLVPVVYLADATRAAQTLDPHNSTIAGYDVNITGQTVRNVGGAIVAGDSLNINTAGSIENTSGRLAGWNVQLNAGGDIVNSTLTRRLGDSLNGTDAAEKIATIEAGNTVILKAANNITVSGAQVNAAKDAALIAGNNVNIQALALNTSITAGDGSWSVKSQSALDAAVSAGGNAIVNAGRDVNIKGADVSAGGVAAVRAEKGNVNVGVLELTHQASSSSTETKFYTQLDTDKTSASATLGAGIEHDTTTHTATDTTGYGSGISGKGVVISTGKGAVNVNGSSINAGSEGIGIDSAGNVNITAYNNKSERTDTSDRVRAGVQVDASADGAFGGLAQSGDKTSTTSTQTTAQTSALHSGGDISINGQGMVTNEGTMIDAAGDVSLSGTDVINKAARDTFTTSTTESKWETKEQEGLTTNGTGDSINNAVQGNGTQVTVNNAEWQQRVTGSYSTDTNTNEQSQAQRTQIKAGGNVNVNAKNNASDEGTQYTAGKDVNISAANYENKAAADTNTSTDETTYGSGKVTAGLNTAAEVALTVSADGGHQKSGQGTSTAQVGSVAAGGKVNINARSGDVTLEGTNVSGANGVAISAARDVNINQANDTTTKSSSEQSGGARLSANVSLTGTGGAVGAGTNTKIADSNDTTSTAKVASINSGNGNVTLSAGRDLTTQGTNVAAAGDVGLQAGRDVKLLAATDTKNKTGSVNSGSVDVNVGFGTDAAETVQSGGANVSFEKGVTDYHETTQHGSNIQSGGQVSVKSGGNAQLQGTQLNAKSANLDVGGNLTLESAQHTVKDNSYDVSSTLGGSVSRGGGTGGASTVGHGGTGNSGAKGGNAGSANAQVNVDSSKQDIVTNTNASINTTGGATVNVGGDLALRGANINAQGGTSGKVGGNLTIETRTDKENVDQANVKAYAGVGPVGGSGGGSTSRRVQEGVQTGANNIAQTGGFTDVNTTKKDNVSIGTASGISGGINMQVGGNTTLTGATNSGSDFKTAGTTAINSVETHSSESGTKFRVAGTVASAAGSDQGKGGDFGLTVHTPEGHGVATPEEPHSPAVAHHAPEDQPAPVAHGREPVVPRAGRQATPEQLAPVAHAPLGEGPAAQHGQPGPESHGLQSQPYANNPAHAAPGEAFANVPGSHGEAPANNPGSHDAQGELHANNPGSHDAQGELHANNPLHASQGEPYGNNPSGHELPAAEPHAPLPDSHSIHPQDQQPAASNIREASADHVPSHVEPQLEMHDPGHVPRLEPGEGHEPPANASHQSRLARDDSHPLAAGEPPAARAEPPTRGVAALTGSDAPLPRVVAAVKDKIAGDEVATRLHQKGEATLAPAESWGLDRNVAEVLSFTQNDPARRAELLGKIQTNLEGPITEDGVKLYPLRPQYVGEDIPGFANWSIRTKVTEPGAASAQGRREVTYYKSDAQDEHVLHVNTDHTLAFNNNEHLPDGKYIFVVDKNGRMIADVAFEHSGQFHHSSLADGQPVRMAGEFTIENGQIREIKNQSGHYRPDGESFKDFLASLQRQQVNLTHATAPTVTNAASSNGGFDAAPRGNLLAEHDALAGRSSSLVTLDPRRLAPSDRPAMIGTHRTDAQAQQAPEEPVPSQSANTGSLAAQRHNVIAGDPVAGHLDATPAHLDVIERDNFAGNLAELVAFTHSPQGAQHREELFSHLQQSLNGPVQRPSDNLTLFPLRPQYVGEDVAGFNNWKIRKPTDAPGLPYQENAPARTTPMRSVRYLNAEQQENARVYVGPDHQLTFKDGKLGNGKWMFVVDENGRMLAQRLPEKTDFLHHSSLSAGKPVLMAGYVKIENDRIVQIRNESGHFRPDIASFERFLVSLRSQNVDLAAASAPAYTFEPEAGKQYRAFLVNRDLLSDPSLSNVPHTRMLDDSMRLHGVQPRSVAAGGQGNIEEVDPYNTEGAHPYNVPLAANHLGDSNHAPADHQEIDPYNTSSNGNHAAENAQAPDHPDMVEPHNNPGHPDIVEPHNNPGHPQADLQPAVGSPPGDEQGAGGVNLPRTPEDIAAIVNSNSRARSLVEQAQALKGTRLNEADFESTQHTLAEIVELSRHDSNEGQKLFSEFEKSLQPPTTHGGIAEFPVLPLYVGESIEGFANLRARVGDERNGVVRYLTPQEQGEGQLYIANGRFTTGQSRELLAQGRYIYVVDTTGRIIIHRWDSDVASGIVHHSSLSNGQPVRMAGEISFQGGKLDFISNRSGHFRPDEKSFEQFVGELQQLKVPMVRKPHAQPEGLEGLPNGGIGSTGPERNLFDNRQSLRPGPARMLRPLSPPGNAQQTRSADPPVTWLVPKMRSNPGNIRVPFRRAA